MSIRGARPVAASVVILWLLCLAAPSLASSSSSIPSAAPTAPTGSQLLQALNALRTSNGFPSVTERSDWSRACAAHLNYMIVNHVWTSDFNQVNPHTEVYSESSYTPEGAWAAGNSVLGGGWPLPPVTSPYGGFYGERITAFDNSPYHLAQLLAPQLQSVGVAALWDTDMQSPDTCVTTFPGFTRTAPSINTVLTFPAADGDVDAFQTAYEWPSTPAQEIGIPDGTPTGPYLYAFAWGPFANPQTMATTATVSGPDGAVPIHIFADIAPGGAIILPVKPLRGGETYTASVTFTRDDEKLTHSWSFHTRINYNFVTQPNEAAVPQWRPHHAGQATVVFTTLAPNATLTIRQGSKVRIVPVALRQDVKPPHVLPFIGRFVRTAAPVVVCAESGGGKNGYLLQRSCSRFP